MRVLAIYHSGNKVLKELTVMELEQAGAEVLSLREDQELGGHRGFDVVLQIGIGPHEEPDGLPTLRKVRALYPELPILVYSRNKLPGIPELVRSEVGACMLPWATDRNAVYKKLSEMLAKSKTAA